MIVNQVRRQYGTDISFTCCRRFPTFRGLVGGIGLGLPRRWSRLGWMGAQLLHHRCQAVGAASMRALQSAADLHDPVVSSRWLNSGPVELPAKAGVMVWIGRAAADPNRTELRADLVGYGTYSTQVVSTITTSAGNQ